MDDEPDSQLPLKRNITVRGRQREEVRGIIWNPRKRRERRRTHQGKLLTVAEKNISSRV